MVSMIVTNSMGETSSQFSMLKSMSRSLSVRQSINSDNYEYAISLELYMLHQIIFCTVDAWLPFSPNLIFRQCEIVACLQRTLVAIGSFKIDVRQE